MTRPVLGPADRVVVKIGTSSLVDSGGRPDPARVGELVAGIAEVRDMIGHVVLVTSGAIAAGLEPLGMARRPGDIPSLQAAAAVGQGVLFSRYASMFARHGVLCAQMLLTREDFMRRQQYINARNTLDRLLSLGSLPIVNENDTTAVDEIRFGDNDRLAALVGNLARARLLILLTDAEGVHAVDPRRDPSAPVLDEVERITPELERAAGGGASDLGSGGMASKIAAAWVATLAGVGVVVAGASTDRVIQRIVAGEPLGTYFVPHKRRVSARRLWIAFAQPPRGTIVVDEGAQSAVVVGKKSLLPAGVRDVVGTFKAGDVTDVADLEGRVFARGLVRYPSDELAGARGRRTTEFAGREVIHRDELFVLDTGAHPGEGGE